MPGSHPAAKNELCMKNSMAQDDFVCVCKSVGVRSFFLYFLWLYLFEMGGERTIEVERRFRDSFSSRTWALLASDSKTI